MLSTIILVLTNLFPAVGIFFFGWDAFDVVFLYWLENAIIGFFNVLKMARCRGPMALPQPGTGPPKAVVMFAFIWIYGLGTVIHGVAVVVLLRLVPEGRVETVDNPFLEVISVFSSPFWLLSGLALLIEYVYLYYADYLKTQQYLRSHAANLMTAGFGRLIVLHLTIVLGGFILSELCAPAPLALLLVVFKIVYEITVSRRRRGDAERPS